MRRFLNACFCLLWSLLNSQRIPFAQAITLDRNLRHLHGLLGVNILLDSKLNTSLPIYSIADLALVLVKVTTGYFLLFFERSRFNFSLLFMENWKLNMNS